MFHNHGKRDGSMDPVCRRASWPVVAILALLLFFTAGTALWAGPFGLEMGMTLAQIEAAAGEKALYIQTIAYAIKAPKLHMSFKDSLLLFISPDTGLCKIVAIGKDIETTGYGTALKSEFDSVKEQLSTVYGTPKVIDYLMYQSIWKDADDWMMALKLEDRKLIAFWNGNETRLSSNLVAIMLEAKASYSTKGNISLIYEFTNFASALEKIKAQSSSAL